MKNKHYTIDSLNLMYRAYLYIIKHSHVSEYSKIIEVYFNKIRQFFDMDSGELNNWTLHREYLSR